MECSLTANNIADPYQMASDVSFCAFSAFLFREIILHAVLAVGQVILSVIHTGRSTSIPLKNDFSRILNPVLSIQDAYDQDQGIFSVLVKKEVRGSGLLFLEKRRAVSSDSAEAGGLSQGTFCEIRDFGIGLPKGTATQLIKQQPQNGRYIPFCGCYVLI